MLLHRIQIFKNRLSKITFFEFRKLCCGTTTVEILDILIFFKMAAFITFVKSQISETINQKTDRFLHATML